jgi:hypothetical protein
MKICYIVHTPFQLFLTTILMKKLDTASTLISLEDGKNQMDLQHTFIQENWSTYHILDIRGIKSRNEKDTPIVNKIFSLINDFNIICILSLHVPVNQIILKHYKGSKKIYVLPEGLLILDYFKKSLHRIVMGKIQGRFNFDYFFTYFGKGFFKHPKVREMPFLLTESNMNLLKLPETDFNDFSKFDIIFCSQPFSEQKKIPGEEEKDYLEKVFNLFSDKKILVFLHPKDNPGKFNCFKNVQTVPSIHFPNEVFLRKCKPKLMIAVASTIVINSAIIFPDVPHILLIKLIKNPKIRKQFENLERFFKLYPKIFPNVFMPSSFNEILKISQQSIKGGNLLPSITEQEFFEKYFRENG